MPPSPKATDDDAAADIDHDASPDVETAAADPIEVDEAPAVADDGSEIHVDSNGTAWQRTEATVIERR